MHFIYLLIYRPHLILSFRAINSFKPQTTREMWEGTGLICMPGISELLYEVSYLSLNWKRKEFNQFCNSRFEHQLSCWLQPIWSNGWYCNLRGVHYWIVLSNLIKWYCGVQFRPTLNETSIEYKSVLFCFANTLLVEKLCPSRMTSTS